MAAGREDCIDDVVSEASPLSDRRTFSHHSQRSMNSLIRLYVNLVRFAKLGVGNAAVIKRQGKSANIL